MMQKLRKGYDLKKLHLNSNMTTKWLNWFTASSVHHLKSQRSWQALQRLHGYVEDGLLGHVLVSVGVPGQGQHPGPEVGHEGLASWQCQQQRTQDTQPNPWSGLLTPPHHLPQCQCPEWKINITPTTKEL